MSIRNIVLLIAVIGTESWLVANARAAPTPVQQGGQPMALGEKDILVVIGQLQAKFGAAEKSRIERGVNQVARLWRAADGSAEEFATFCADNYATGKDLDAIFERFESKLEQVGGAFNSLTLALRLQLDEDTGPLLPVDQMFAEFNPAAHLQEDLFQTKLAFLVLLNFPARSLDECLTYGDTWNRRQWAEARLAQGFLSRVPADVTTALTKAYANADAYVTKLIILMDHVVSADGKPVFREGLKLISHWGLRDELKALYVDPAGNLAQQKIIKTIMERILTQEIPGAVYGNPAAFWDPVTNTVNGKPDAREPDTRFAKLLTIFKAHAREDAFYPTMPTHIDRRFQRDREIPEAEVSALLESVLKAPVASSVARLIEKRLGRNLQPFDIWYDGFKARGKISEEELDAAVRARYPNLEAFHREIPSLLGKLGFDPQTAAFLTATIEVDPARGSGHAWGPYMRSEKAHLRTRVPEHGMNYQGFNVAMHELGHNVEQVFSLYRLDHTLLQGVPNTAFTEGFAFVFQARDLEVLGLAKPDQKADAAKTLDAFWATREIAGVGLVDMRVWRWMYAHPDATPEQLRQQVVTIAKEVWNSYFASVFGIKDSPLLAVYSHMINNGLYLPDYPIGHLIAFQIEDYFKSHPLAKEMERMCSQGRLAPNLWLKQAIGMPISSKPLLDAAEKALRVIKP
jgi:hypothetical protein